ncbi:MULTISPECIES: PQQ-binding-like beta-propeller repeat protein [unclassified Sphingobacterium]|uniref:PQQ-binding-like beta-propeller repeat protein n=1 Tax=unclassified Sphingobacterium TaxID=2609468 RepID=UPI00293C024F|nr:MULTISPECIES: PQQ-binding-like beta-propeller repeat protein [unclassified Sphingobacterium]
MTFNLFISAICLVMMQQAVLARPLERGHSVYPKETTHELPLKWKVQTKGKVFSSPVVQDGILYVGSCDSSLYAIEAAQGNVLWQYRTGGEIRSAVAVGAGLVYVLATDGHLYALDAKSGLLRWKYQTEGEQVYDAWDYYLSAPVLDRGFVYFGSGDGHVYALHAHDGSLHWRYKTGGIVHASPVVADGAIFIGSFDGFFYCLERDGSLRWKFDTLGESYFPKGEVQFHAVVSEGRVYFGARDFNLYALNTKDGTGHWVYHQQGSWISVPNVYKDRLVVTMSDSFSALVVDKATGKVLAEPAVPLNVFASPSLSGDFAYFGAIDGVLYRLAMEGQQLKPVFQTEWSKRHRSDFFGANGAQKEGLLSDYNGDINRLFDAYHEMGSIFSTVCIEQDRLYFGASDGIIYALQKLQ